MTDNLMFCAEIGSNWFGSIEIAKYLMDKAKESGANFVKMQFYPCDELYDKNWTFYKMAKKCELSYDTARELKEYADKIGIGWFASVHTKEDIDFLVDIKAPFIKIKASQRNDDVLTSYAIATGIKTIISHPYNMLVSYANALNLLTTPKYPSRFEDIRFNELKKGDNSIAFHCDGFSDHTQGIQASLCAAMYSNIRIFERHFTGHLGYKFTINEKKTPDSCVSLYPEQFKRMVEKIKWIKQEK